MVPCYVPAGQTWVVVDGDPRTARLLRELIAARMPADAAPRVLELPENRGKFGVLCAGIAALLEASPGVDYIAIRGTAATATILSQRHDGPGAGGRLPGAPTTATSG
jgi:hypothetical protein